MDQLIELTAEECVELLHTAVVGRVVLQTPAGIRIVPVNYAIHGDAIVWRTTPFSELGQYGAGREILFEVDDLNFEEHRAWSVIATGILQLVEDPDEVLRISAEEDPAPWAPGAQRHLYMRLAWRSVTGRRIGETRITSGLIPLPEELTPRAYR